MEKNNEIQKVEVIESLLNNKAFPPHLDESTSPHNEKSSKKARGQKENKKNCNPQIYLSVGYLSNGKNCNNWLRNNVSSQDNKSILCDIINHNQYRAIWDIYEKIRHGI